MVVRWSANNVRNRRKRRHTSLWTSSTFPASCRPCLEALEDRTLPSVLTVLNTLDSGSDSLRAIVASANPGDTIVFSAALSGQTISLTSGQIDITTSLTIDGLGASNLTISGNGNSRVFEIGSPGSGGQSVQLSDLTITNGNAGYGGNILNYGNLTITNSVVSDGMVVGFQGASGFQRGGAGGGSAGMGGAIFNAGSLQLVGSTLDGNFAYGGQGASLYDDLIGNGLGSGGGGGGLDGDGQPGGNYSLGGDGGGTNGGTGGNEGSTGGTGGFGGGGGGGGATFPGVGGGAGGQGGFGAGGGGGAAYETAGAPGGTGGPGGDGGFGGGGGGRGAGTPDGSIGLAGFGGGDGGHGDGSGNIGSPGGGGAGMGGAIFNDGGNVTLTNDTLTANQAIGGDGGEIEDEFPSGLDGGTGSGLGGAIFNYNGALKAINVTIAANTADYGGGIYAVADSALAAVNLTNTIVAQSAGGVPDFDSATIGEGLVTTAGTNNLVEVNASFVGTGTITGVDPGLNVLANNGGPTPTMALQANSPCIGAGNSALAPSTDQRGSPRNSPPDIGAYEFDPVFRDAVAGLAITGLPTSANAGTELDITVSAVDTYGNVVPSFNGTVQLSSNDPLAEIPPDIQLVNGSASLFIAFPSGGTKTLTVTDPAMPSFTDTQSVQINSVIFPTGVIIVPRLNEAFTGVVATFTASFAATTNDFAAGISWGDGTLSLGAVAVDPNGGFEVIGTHTYTTVTDFLVDVIVVAPEQNTEETSAPSAAAVFTAPQGANLTNLSFQRTAAGATTATTATDGVSAMLSQPNTDGRTLTLLVAHYAGDPEDGAAGLPSTTSDSTTSPDEFFDVRATGTDESGSLTVAFTLPAQAGAGAELFFFDSNTGHFEAVLGPDGKPLTAVIINGKREFLFTSNNKSFPTLLALSGTVFAVSAVPEAASPLFVYSNSTEPGVENSANGGPGSASASGQFLLVSYTQSSTAPDPAGGGGDDFAAAFALADLPDAPPLFTPRERKMILSPSPSNTWTQPADPLSPEEEEQFEFGGSSFDQEASNDVFAQLERFRLLSSRFWRTARTGVGGS